MTLLLCVCSGAWADELMEDHQYAARALTNGSNLRETSYLSSLTVDGTSGTDWKNQSGKLQILKGKTVALTVNMNTSKLSGFHISKVVLGETSSDKVSSCSSTDGTMTHDSEHSLYTFMPSTSTKTSVTMSFTANSSNAIEFTSIKVYMSDGGSETCESLTSTMDGNSDSSSDITCSSTLSPSKVTQVTASTGYATQDSYKIIQTKSNPSSLRIQTSRPIKAIYFSWYSNAPADDKWNDGLASHGTYSNNKWTAPAGNYTVKDVTFTRTAGSTGRIGNIHVVYHDLKPTITTQPSSANYATGDTPENLSVTATLSDDASSLSYQWKQCDDAEGNNPTNATFTGNATNTLALSELDTSSEGTYYYYCVVTDQNGTTNSNVATITVTAPIAPTVTASASATTVLPETVVTLTATVTGGVPDPTLQWYSNTSNTREGATEIDDETSETYTPNTASEGTMYYFVKAHNDGGDAYSDIIKILVTSNQVAQPSYKIGPYNYTEGGYEVIITCATNDVTIEYLETTNNSQTAELFDAADPSDIKTYSAGNAFVTAKKRIAIRATKENYVPSYGNTSNRYMAADAPTGTSPEVIKINASSANDGGMDHGNRAVRIPGGTYPDNPVVSSTDYFKMRRAPSGITPIITGKSACLQMTVNSGYEVSNVTFTNLQSNYDAAIDVEELYVDGEKVNDFVPFTIPGNGNPEIATKSVDLSTSAKESIVFTFGSSTATQYKATITTTYKQIVSGTITDCGWSTFASSSKLDLSGIENGTAYYASAATGSTVTLTPCNDKIVQSGEGLMIKGTAGKTFTIPVTTEDVTFSEENFLKGQTTTGNVDASNKNDNGKYHYVFGYKTSDATEYGFYNLAADTELAAGKAYLETTTALTQGARISIVFDDEETGINDVKSVQKNDNRYYNLNGLEVAQPTKGLYIVNGKKVVIK